MKVEKGNKVKVEYEGKFEDGTVFDSTEKHNGEPIEFQVGAGMVVPGFENAVVGMEVDEEKEVTLKPEEAYGQPNENMVKEIPRDVLPKDQEPQEGMMIGLALSNGAKIPGKIVSVDEKVVKVDLNHPLAGKTLTFKLKVKGISEGEPIPEHSCGGCGDGSCSDGSCGDKPADSE